MKPLLTTIAIIIGVPCAFAGVLLGIAGLFLMLPLAWVVGNNKL